MKNNYTSLALAAMLTLGFSGLANATSIINYRATNLADVNLDEDIWQYTYTVTGDNFTAGAGFSIEFEKSLYVVNSSPQIAPNNDWEVYTYDSYYNPDVSVYDAYTMKNDASLDGQFSITFVWKGGIEGPGAQFFNVYDQNLIIQQWGTTSPVPEPATVLLFGSGLVTLCAVARRKRMQHGD